MILSAQSIRKRGIITPFCEKTVFAGKSFGLSHAGYDIRVKQRLVLAPGSFSLASSMEEFDMPTDLLGQVCDKSSWARMGVCVQNTILEPGWRGFLTLEITNHGFGDKPLVIEAGSPIAQIIFHLLDEPTDTPYRGKYQDQADMPVEAIYEH
jgi:dCTP deaminase